MSCEAVILLLFQILCDSVVQLDHVVLSQILTFATTRGGIVNESILWLALLVLQVAPL